MKSINYSLKRSSLLLLFFVFSLSGFSASPYNDSLVYSTGQGLSASVYTYTSPSSSKSVNYNNIADLYALSAIYKNVPFGLGVRASDGYITAPSLTSSSNNAVNVNYQIKVYFYNSSSNLTSRYFSPRSFSTVAPLYTFAALLFSSGYTGPAIDVVGVQGQYTYFNFDYRLAISDTLCSTNTVYRSLVLSHLNSISSSVVNIDTGVSAISSALIPSLSRIEEINSGISSDLVDIKDDVDSIQSYSSEINETLHGIDGFVSGVNPRIDSVTNLLVLLHNDSVTGNLDVLLGDDTSSWVGYANWACDNFYITEEERDYFISEFQATDPDSPSRSRSYSIPDSHRRLLAKSNLKGRVVAANKMRGLYQSFHAGESSQPTIQRNWFGSFIGEFGDRANTGVRHEIMNNAALMADWRDGLRQQLQDWKTSDEHGILNVKNKIDDVDSSIKKNFEFQPDSSLTNTIPYTSFVTNYVTAPLTNSIEEASGRIVTNASENAQALRDFLHDNLISPDAEGAAVRIKYPIWGEHESAVHVHDESWDVFGSGLDELNYNVTAVLGDMNSRWSEWFRRWDDFAPPVHSNIEEILDVLLHWTNTTAQLNHVLFEDYSNYVHSAYYDNLFSTLENDYPVCYSNLVKFGLSSSADGGRWWNVLSSSVSYDTAMMSYVFSDMVELDRIARDNLGESPFSFLQRTLNDMPSKSQIEDYVSQASNATSEVEYAFSSLSNSLAVVSNSIDSVFNPFRGHFDSPGSSVTFFKIHDGHDGQYVTIPVSDQSDAWRYIRLGVSFGLVAVNFLLFPKYLLMLFTLFIKAYRIGIKFFPDDR